MALSHHSTRSRSAHTHRGVPTIRKYGWIVSVCALCGAWNVHPIYRIVLLGDSTQSTPNSHLFYFFVLRFVSSRRQQLPVLCCVRTDQEGKWFDGFGFRFRTSKAAGNVPRTRLEGASIEIFDHYIWFVLISPIFSFLLWIWTARELRMGASNSTLSAMSALCQWIQNSFSRILRLLFFFRLFSPRLCYEMLETFTSKSVCSITCWI